MPFLEFMPTGRWNTRETISPGDSGFWARWHNSHKGYRCLDRGFVIDRTVEAVASKAAASFVHEHSDGGQHLVYYVNTQLYNTDDSATPVITSIAAGLTEVFVPVWATLGGGVGQSVFINGNDDEAHIVREISSAAAAHLFEIAGPTVAAHTTATSGGSIADGTYQILVCLIDENATPHVFSIPGSNGGEGTAQSLTTSGGGASTITIKEPTSIPSRITHWRYAITAAGASDSPANYTPWVDVAKGAGDQTITSLPSAQTTQAFTSINGVYRQAEMPLDNVDVAVEHNGRMFIASSQSNEVYWSERGNLNHFYNADSHRLIGGAEGDTGGGIIAMASTLGRLYVFTARATYQIAGDFKIDQTGDNPTYAANAYIDTIDRSTGVVARGSIVEQAGWVYALTNRGPGVLVGGSWRLLDPDGIQRFWHCIDTTYLGRIVGCEDVSLNAICWLVPRETNASRAMDGASQAGICDTIIRWDIVHKHWMEPIQLDLVHIASRWNGTQGSTGNPLKLMAMSPHGICYEMNKGWSGGALTDSSNYDGLLATAETTTSATVTLSGISADDFNGYTVTIKYYSGDSNYPNVIVQKQITDTAVSGTDVTISWIGAITVSSGTKWTIRIGGRLVADHWPVYPPDFGAPVVDQQTAEPVTGYDIQRVDYFERDLPGEEAIS